MGTDVAIVIAQMINGNYKGTPKGSILGLICFFFWFGGVIGYFGVQQFTTYTLLINAIIFYLCGLVLVVYVMQEYGVSFVGAVTGTWKWKQVLKKLNTSEGDLTKEKLMQIFDDIDADGDGTVTRDEWRALADKIL